MRKLGLVAAALLVGCTTDVTPLDVEIERSADSAVSWSAYRFAKTDAGFAARNVDEGFSLIFDRSGATLSGKKMSDAMSLRLSAWGRLGQTHPTAQTEPELGDCASNGGSSQGECVRRVRYDHVDVHEWFENGPSGVMHGWTLLALPAEEP